MKKRMRLRFYGTVQGVGFRFSAYHAANSLGVTGWVMNDFDGSVLMEAQGDESAIQTLVGTLRAQPWIEISNVLTAEIPVLDGEGTFSIRGA